jgi:hypothetical protein
MIVSRAMQVAQLILFTTPWTAPIFLLIVVPTFSEAFMMTAIVWAVISPIVLLGTSIVAYRTGVIKSALTKDKK